jgi:hypothetical protein
VKGTILKEPEKVQAGCSCGLIHLDQRVEVSRSFVELRSSFFVGICLSKSARI